METLYLNTEICNKRNKENIFTKKDFYFFGGSIKYMEIDNGELDIFFIDGTNERFVLEDLENTSKEKIKIGWRYIKNYQEVLELLKLSKLAVRQ